MAIKHPPRCLPGWIRDKGVTTQKQLVMALLPYLEWRSKQTLTEVFLRVLPHAETSPRKSSALDRQILELLKLGVIERTYGETPPAPVRSPNATPHRYVYYRRISRKMPRAKRSVKATEAGALENAVIKSRIPRRRFKKTNVHLTASDVEFIKCNPYGMSTRELGGMFRICQSTAWRISEGKIPKHLKNQFRYGVRSSHLQFVAQCPTTEIF